jgi:hypothetical protein
MKTIIHSSQRKNDPVSLTVFLVAYVAILAFLIAPDGTFGPSGNGPNEIAAYTDN